MPDDKDLEMGITVRLVIVLQNKIQNLESALRYITQKRGQFSQDHLTHAQNCIEDMSEVAQKALDGKWDTDNV